MKTVEQNIFIDMLPPIGDMFQVSLVYISHSFCPHFIVYFYKAGWPRGRNARLSCRGIWVWCSARLFFFNLPQVEHKILAWTLCGECSGQAAFILTFSSSALEIPSWLLICTCLSSLLAFLVHDLEMWVYVACHKHSSKLVYLY